MGVIFAALEQLKLSSWNALGNDIPSNTMTAGQTITGSPC